MATSFGPRYSTPEKFRAVYLDINNMRSFLKEAPLEFSEASRSTSFIVAIPMPDGSMESFEIFESPVMAPGLAIKYQSIKTYAGRGITDPRAHIRLMLQILAFTP
jgi:hypothetical protein